MNRLAMVYGVIVLGVTLSFAAAVVPHFTTGHMLRLSVLAAGLSPYLVLGALSRVAPGGPLLTGAVLLFGIHLPVVLWQRVLDYDGYAAGYIFFVPSVAAVILAVVLGVAARRPARAASVEPPPASDAAKPVTS